VLELNTLNPCFATSFHVDGQPVRHDAALWYSSGDFHGQSLHAFHQSTSLRSCAIRFFQGIAVDSILAIVGLTIASPIAFLEPCRVLATTTSATTTAVGAVGALA
jgi:hypothetical protein